MSGAEFFKAFSDSLLNDRQRYQQQQWAMERQRQQFDMIRQQEIFRSGVRRSDFDYEQAQRQKNAPPTMRQFRGEDGGLMQVESKWQDGAWKDYGEAQPVPVTRTGTRTIPVGDERITYDEYSDGSRKEFARGNARSNEQTANSIAVDARAEQRRKDAARRDAIAFVKGLDDDQIEEMGGRTAAIKKMEREYLGEVAQPGDVKASGSGGLMGEIGGREFKATDQDGKPAMVDAQDKAIARIVDSPEYQRAPIGKTFDVNGDKWVKTEDGLKPAGADKAQRPDASPTDPKTAQALQDAQSAIQRGAPRDAVLRRLQEMFPGQDFQI